MKIKRNKTDIIHDTVTAVLAAIMLIAVVISVFPKFNVSEAEKSRGAIYSLDSGWRSEDGSEITFPYSCENCDRITVENELSEKYAGLSVILTVKNAAVRVSYGDGSGNFRKAYENGFTAADENASAHYVTVSENNIVGIPDILTESAIRLELERISGELPIIIEHCTVTRTDTVLVQLIETSLSVFLCVVIILVCAVEMYIADLIKVFAGWGQWETPFLILFGILSILYGISEMEFMQTVIGNTQFFSYLSAVSLSVMTPVMASYIAGRENGKTAYAVKAAVWLSLILITSGAIAFSDDEKLHRTILVVSACMLSISLLTAVILYLIKLIRSKNKGLLPETGAFMLLFFGALRNVWEVVAGNDTNIGSQAQIISTAVFFVIMTVVQTVRIVGEYRRRTEKAEKEAIAASEAKSSFLSSMSHEIRTPINAVLGMNEMVLRECEDENILAYSANIRTAGNTLLGLINDILDFSKIEAGKLDILPVDYDLASLLNDLVTMINIRAEAKGLALILDVDEKIPKLLHGDEIRIKQIITNILTNAVKYTEKGSVTFAMGFEKENEQNILLRVSITDTGIGIKSEDIPKLFSAFDRIEETRNRSIEGTGLGMNITQRLLTMMDSRLEVTSEYGRGSTFSFAVKQKVVVWEPVGNYEEAFRRSLTERKKYHEKFTAPDAHILVVDDTPMNIEVFINLLKKTLVRTDTADSGVKCLELAASTKYDVIFLDHMMPDMDGIETLKRLKDLPDGTNKDTPVICLTANAVSGAREKYLSAGFDDYLTKPIDPNKLEEALAGYLPEEKVKPAAAVSPDISQTSQVIPDIVLSSAEIDTAQGLKHCGSKDIYLQTLITYAGAVNDLTKEIERYWKSGDTADLTIKVHALKSTSRVIGAMKLGDLAEKLEKAGHDNDTDTINLHIDELLERCRALGAQLAPLLKNEALPQITDDELQEAYTLIREFLSVEDYESAMQIIGSLSEYDYPEKEKMRCEELKKAAAEFDYDKMKNIMED